MNPGEFNKRLTFQVQNPNAKDEDGFPLPPEQQWQDFKKVWGKAKTVKGYEYYQAAQDQSENTTRWIIRYTKGLTSDMRVLYKGRVFEIENILHDDEQEKTLTVICKEVNPIAT